MIHAGPLAIGPVQPNLLLAEGCNTLLNENKSPEPPPEAAPPLRHFLLPLVTSRSSLSLFYTLTNEGRYWYGFDAL